MVDMLVRPRSPSICDLAEAAGTGSSIHPEPTGTTVRILSSQASIVATQAQMHLLPGCCSVVLNSNQY
jgi:hypothetical protein